MLGPRHDPRTIAAQERSTHGVNVHVGRVALGPVYLLMGGDLEVVPSVAAGLYFLVFERHHNYIYTVLFFFYALKHTVLS